MNTETEKTLRVFHTTKLAWQHVKGAKWPIWLTMIVSTVINVVVIGVVDLVMIGNVFNHASLRTQHPFTAFLGMAVAFFFIALISAPLLTGLFMIAIKRARGETVTAGTGFKYFRHWGRLALTYILVIIFVILIELVIVMLVAFIAPLMAYQSTAVSTLGVVLMCVVGVVSFFVYLFYLSFANFSLPSVVDKNLSPWAAFRHAYRISKPHWIKLVMLYITIVILGIIAYIPIIIQVALGAGTSQFPTWAAIVCPILFIIMVIWYVPMAFMMLGEAYVALDK